MTGVGCELKSKKLTHCFIGSYQITQRVGFVAYIVVLPPSLLNLHDIFHVSKVMKYISDPSHLIQTDECK